MSSFSALLRYLLFTLARRLLRLGQRFYWLFTGTGRHLRLTRSKPELYPLSAQLLDVHYRYTFSLILQACGADNFITTHRAFVHPDYVLQDHVSLYSLSSDEAVFVETSRDIDVSHSDNGCFMRMAQYDLARRLVVLPIESVHRLAEHLGDPHARLVLVSNTARCGSTLLCQMFEQTGQCMALSEPDFLRSVESCRRQLGDKETRRLMRSAIRLQCKPINNRSIDAYVIKSMSQHVDCVPMFVELFPASKQLFMYRDGVAVTRSVLKLLKVIPGFKEIMTMVVSSWVPKPLRSFLFNLIGFPIELQDLIVSDFTLAVTMWALTCRTYSRLRSDGYSFSALRYEHLLADPERSFRAILETCELPVDWAEQGVKALQRDSQRGSVISRQVLAAVRGIDKEFDDRGWLLADAICDKMGVPRLRQEGDLEGTVTGKRENDVSN